MSELKLEWNKDKNDEWLCFEAESGRIRGKVLRGSTGIVGYAPFKTGNFISAEKAMVAVEAAIRGAHAAGGLGKATALAL